MTRKTKSKSKVTKPPPAGGLSGQTRGDMEEAIQHFASIVGLPWLFDRMPVLENGERAAPWELPDDEFAALVAEALTEAVSLLLAQAGHRGGALH
jgi:hypothetical protein